jgi:mRNA-degrading endonuclease toxin of MazEF toxin-antitoxin module
VVLVSHNGFNQTAAWKSLIVIPLSTSTAQGKRGPTIVDIPAGAGGLLKPSFALCHQVTTLDRAKIGKRIGSLSNDLLARVDESLKAALDLD